MKIKNTLMLGLLISAVSLSASEPFILKTNSGRDIFKEKPALFSKKKKSSMATVDGESNIVVKLNASQLGLKNISLQGEYGFHPKMSVAIGFSSFLNREFPIYQEEGNFGPINYKGFALTPEFRFYPGGKEGKIAPRGFYLAAYLRYAKYKMTQQVSYTEENTPTNPHPFPKTYTANSIQTYGGVNGGLMIGYQWIIGDHFSIDFWIIGGGYGKAKYTYEWVVPGASLSAEDQATAKKAAEENLDTYSYLGLGGNVTTTPNSVKTTVTGVPMISLRGLGLCFGFAF